MELSHEVQTLLSIGASFEEIYFTMQELYQIPHLNEPHWSMLPSYAVHHNHPLAEKFLGLTSLRPLHYIQSTFNPLVTAVMEGKLDCIQKFVGKFWPSGRTYDNMLGDTGYGIISDGILMPIKVSPLDIILQTDDMGALKMFNGSILNRFNLWEIKALLKICKRADAQNCIKGLQDMLATDDHFFDTDILLFDLTSFACYLPHDISDLMRNYIIHFHATVVERYGAVKSKYLTENEIELLKEVVNDEASVHGLTIELIGRIILDTCIILLFAKKCAKFQSLVPDGVITKLTRKIRAVVDPEAIESEVETVPVDTDTDTITFLQCAVSLTQMCFQHGVGRRKFNALTGMSSCWYLDEYDQLFPPEYDQSRSKIFSLLCEQLRILVVSKYIHIDTFIPNITRMSSPHLKYLVRTCVDMMPQQIFEKYQMKIKELQQKVEEEERKNPDIQNKELINENNRIIANCSQKTGVRLLQQLCRVKVHDFIPEGQLPPAAHKLQIPVNVQKDLACGVTQE